MKPLLPGSLATCEYSTIAWREPWKTSFVVSPVLVRVDADAVVLVVGRHPTWLVDLRVVGRPLASFELMFILIPQAQTCGYCMVADFIPLDAARL